MVDKLKMFKFSAVVVSVAALLSLVVACGVEGAIPNESETATIATQSTSSLSGKDLVVPSHPPDNRHYLVGVDVLPDTYRSSGEVGTATQTEPDTAVYPPRVPLVIELTNAQVSVPVASETAEIYLFPPAAVVNTPSMKETAMVEAQQEFTVNLTLELWNGKALMINYANDIRTSDAGLSAAESALTVIGEDLRSVAYTGDWGFFGFIPERLFVELGKPMYLRNAYYILTPSYVDTVALAQKLTESEHIQYALTARKGGIGCPLAIAPDGYRWGQVHYSPTFSSCGLIWKGDPGQAPLNPP